MTRKIDTIISRQNDISSGIGTSLNLPHHSSYAVCNLRGSIGKTSLTFNLSYLTDNLLTVDTCPQGNLSYFYNNSYYQNVSTTVNDMLLPYFFAGLNKASRVAQHIGSTNEFFARKNSFFLPSSSELYRTYLKSLKRSDAFNHKPNKTQFEFGISISPFKVLNQRLTPLYPSI